MDGRVQGVTVIPLAITRLMGNLSEDLLALFSSDTVLVPAPGSSPQRAGSLWVPERICSEIFEVGLGQEMEPLLVRLLAVPKSAFAAPSERPTPLRYYETLGVIRRLGVAPKKITVVDDVITKGATLLAAASLFKEAFPEADVRAFALMRTTRPEPFRDIVDPVAGRVVLHSDYTTREP